MIENTLLIHYLFQYNCNYIEPSNKVRFQH
jgi:hypothetical protein